MRRVFCCITIAAALCASPCFGGEVVKTGGTGTALGLLKLLGAAFERSHAGMTVEVLPSLGSSGAIKAFLQGAIDVAISSRPLNDTEKKQGLSLLEYARTPLMPVAEKSATESNLTHEQLLKIYGGEATAWQNGARIRPIMRLASESDTLILKAVSPEMAAAIDGALSRPGMQIANTDQENAAMIAKTPGAFGFVTLTQYVTEGLSVGILAYDGVTPSLKGLSTHAYPLSKPLGVVTGPGATARGNNFIAFMWSAAGRSILEQSGCLFTGGR